VTVTDITGRDAYLLAEALAHAIVLLRAQEHPAHSNIESMQALLDHLCSDQLTQEVYFKEAVRHLQLAMHPPAR
jgi:hypothetical protein